MRLLNHANYKRHHTYYDVEDGFTVWLGIGEKNTLPSETVPGQTLTLDQLLKKYVRGEKVTTFTPQFSDDEDLPDNIEQLDEMDRLDLARTIKEGIDHYRSRPKKQALPSTPENVSPPTES